MKNIMILFGGQSSEHEVSRVSAKNVIDNIDKTKFNVLPVGITKSGDWLPFNGETNLIADGSWEKKAKIQLLEYDRHQYAFSPKEMLSSLAGFFGHDHIDVVHPVLHGINGEDGTVQGLLELAEVAYVGPNVLGSAAGMDKEISKIIFENAGIPQGKYFCVTRTQLEQESEKQKIFKRASEYLGFPCFIKPANAGSSVGVGKANNQIELFEALANAAIYDSKILVEQFINAREVECAVLGNEYPQASVLGEIVASNDFYDYKAKYIDNKSECIIPADLPAELSDKMRIWACEAFKALQCEGLSRVDFFVDKDTGEVYLNEVNTLPGFTSISMYPMLWDATGLPYSKLLEKLYELAIERKELRKREINI